jgi:predicted RNA-binding protein with PUA-like domain
VALWLFKEEPTHYSFADLESDGGTVWNGIANPTALQNLRKVKRGDRVFYYHTGKEKAVVGEMRATSDARTISDDPKSVEVEVTAVKKLARPVTLAEIKKDPALSSWELVRISRLSIVPVTEVQWQRVEELSRGG